MVWIFFLLVAVAVVAVTVALATGRVPVDPMADAGTSVPDHGLAESGFAAADVDLVRFDTALRGYRMDQVDDVIDRLQARIAELEGGERRLSPHGSEQPAEGGEGRGQHDAGHL